MAATRCITISATASLKTSPKSAGVGGGGFSTGAAWGDYDRDGNVDLFVSRYIHTDARNLGRYQD